MSDYYTLLGVTTDASLGEIKAAYRREALKWHPDRNTDQSGAEEKFKRIGEAYATLSDPAQRRSYDKQFARQNVHDESSRDYEDVHFDYATASRMFFDEMVRVAYELSFQNAFRADIANELINRGCPLSVAYEISRRVDLQRKLFVRKQGSKLFVRSAVSLTGGLILTGLLWELGFIALVGPILMFDGLRNGLRALYYIGSGRAPVANN